MPSSLSQPHRPLRNPASAALLVAAVATVVGGVPAQAGPGIQFGQLVKRHLPPDALDTRSLAQGDVDRDGDVDVVVGVNGQNRLYLNDGNAIFVDATAGRMPIDNDNTTAVEFGDVDGDGDLDLVVGNNGPQQRNRLYLNNGAGVFSDATAGRLPIDSGALALRLGDVDGDGDLDLVIGNYNQQTRLYRNSGSGVFTDATASNLPSRVDRTLALQFVDVDSDGDRDLVVGASGQSRLLLNNGSGTFVDATASRMPVVHPLENHDPVAIVPADIDGDGDLDLLLANPSFPTGSPDLLLYLNSGTGLFVDATAARVPQTYGATTVITVGDIDGDGDLDLILCQWGGPCLLYLNNGTGTFSNATAGRFPPVVGTPSAALLGDLDRDGDPDFLVGNSLRRNMLFLNDGSGAFVDATAAPLPEGAGMRCVAAGDVDGDGDRDIITGGTVAPNRLFVNDGGGRFRDASTAQMPQTSGELTHSLTLGDVDGDGDLDLVVGNQRSFFPYGQDLLYRNNGAGIFTDETFGNLPFDSDDASAIALGDVDGDRDLDMVVGNLGQQNRLYLNQGTGTFVDATSGRMPTVADQTQDIILRDLDGDGHADIVVANHPGQSMILRNNGQGSFTTHQFFAAGNAIAYGDVEGDGDIDLVLGRGEAGYLSNRQDLLLLNDGTGSFVDATQARMPLDMDVTNAVTLGDIDGDGDLDLVSGNAWNTYQNLSTGSDRLYLNDGSGFFSAAAAVRLGSGDTDAQILTDLDRDGDLDLVNGRTARPVGIGNGASLVIWWNLQRQIDAPYLLRPGRPYTLEVYSRYATPSAFDTALTFLSTTRQTIPLPPYGILGIDPMTPLLPIFLPQPAGMGSTTWNVPNNPAFAGIEIFAQAVILHWPNAIRLTNATADVLLR